MKRLLSIIGLVVIAAIATLFLAPFLVSPQAIATVVEDRLELMTGRAVALRGPVAVSVFPDLVARIDDVEIANAEGMGDEPLAHMAAIDAQVRLLPLLQGRIEVARLTFVEPRIALSVDKQGRRNWTFEPAKAEIQDGNSSTAEQPSGSPATVRFAGIGQLRIERGTLSFTSPGGSSQHLADIDASLSWPQLADALEFSTSLNWQGAPLTLSGNIAAPQQLAAGGSSTADLTIAAGELRSTFSGRLNFGADFAGEGQLQITAPSLRKTAALFGAKMPTAQGFDAFSLNAAATLGGNKLSLGDATLQLDDNTAEGALGLTFGGARPAIRATLAFASLNLNPYVADTAVAADGGQAATSAAPQAAAPRRGWSDKSIDLSGLAAVDADLRISANEIALRDLPLGGGALTLTTANSQLVAEIGELQGYNGKLAGTLNVHVGREAPAYALALTARDVALQPFLSDLIGLSRLSATGNVDLSLKSSGRNEQEIMANMSGSAAANTGPGVISGIDLASIAGLLQTSALDGWQQDGGGQTAFDSLQASFIVENGIARNDDLALKGAALAMNGAGIIDLPARTLDYRLETAIASGLVSRTDGTSQQLRLPIIVRGSWDRPSISVDPAGLIQNAPVIEDTVKNVKDAIKSGDFKSVEDQLKNSGLKSLFDNLTGRKKN